MSVGLVDVPYRKKYIVQDQDQKRVLNTNGNDSYRKTRKYVSFLILGEINRYLSSKCDIYMGDCIFLKEFYLWDYSNEY